MHKGMPTYFIPVVLKQIWSKRIKYLRKKLPLDILATFTIEPSVQ